MAETEFISAEDELALIHRYQAGDYAALGELLEAHSGYIHLTAQKWFKRVRRWCEYDDCFQTAVLGAIRAARKFDCQSGLRWSTYATWWMRSMLGHMRQSASVIHVPASQYNTPLEDRIRKMVSADEPFNGGTRTLAMTLEDHTDVSVSANREEADALIHKAIQTLKPRSQDIILNRMFGKTLDQIGLVHGITKERVRQIEEKAEVDVALFLYRERRRLERDEQAKSLDLCRS